MSIIYCVKNQNRKAKCYTRNDVNYTHEMRIYKARHECKDQVNKIVLKQVWNLKAKLKQNWI